MPTMWNICISICGATDDPRVNAKAQSASDSHMLQGTFRPAGSNWCFFPRRDMKHLLPAFNSVKIAIRIPLIWMPGIIICKWKVRLAHKIEWCKEESRLKNLVLNIHKEVHFVHFNCKKDQLDTNINLTPFHWSIKNRTAVIFGAELDRCYICKLEQERAGSRKEVRHCLC